VILFNYYADIAGDKQDCFLGHGSSSLTKLHLDTIKNKTSQTKSRKWLGIVKK